MHFRINKYSYGFQIYNNNKGIGGRIKQFCEDFIVKKLVILHSTNHISPRQEGFTRNQLEEVFEKKKDNDQLLVDMESSIYQQQLQLMRCQILRTSKKIWLCRQRQRAMTVQRISIYEPSEEKAIKVLF